MGIKFTNNAGSFLSANLTAGATTLQVVAGTGAAFPSLAAGDFFIATLTTLGDATRYEIVKVTARATDTFTIVRAQEGTTAKTFVAGDLVDLRLTAGSLGAITSSTAREIGGTAYSSLLGIASPPSLELKTWDYRDDTDGIPAISSFTRASTATYTDATGTIKTALAGDLRHDYDPVTGEYRGWLIEESRTNLLTYSEDFRNTAQAGETRPWSGNSVIVLADAATAPDGLETADKLSETADTNFHGLLRTNTITAGSTLVVSLFVEDSGDGRYGHIFVRSNSFTNGFAVFFDPADSGYVASSAFGTGSIISAGVEDAGGGRLRVWAVGTVDPAATSVAIQPGLSTTRGASVSYAGDGSSGYYLWGAQLEVGAFPTSYIPTTTAAATRAADVLSVATSAFPYNASEGTLYVDYQTLDTTTTAVSRVATLWDGTSAERININAQASSSTASLFVVDGGTTQASHTVTADPTKSHRVAGAWSLNDFAISVDGRAPSTGSSGTVPTVTTLLIGAYSTAILNGTIRHIAYFPRRLTNAQLQTLTA